MNTRSEKAVAKFRQGFNCAQSVLFCFCDALGIDQESALKIACGFGAGMARHQNLCGAVAGGIMVIGSTCGRGEQDDTAAMETTYAKTRDLMERFAAERGSVVCRDLLNGCRLTTAQGQQYFKDHDLLNKICVPNVQSVVAILEQMLPPE